MLLFKADGFTVCECRICSGNLRASESFGGEETCKNVVQLG